MRKSKPRSPTRTGRGQLDTTGRRARAAAASRAPKANHRICSRGPEDFGRPTLHGALHGALQVQSILPNARGLSPVPKPTKAAAAAAAALPAEAPPPSQSGRGARRRPAAAPVAAKRPVLDAPAAPPPIDPAYAAAWQLAECKCKTYCGAIAVGHVSGGLRAQAEGANRYTMPTPAGLLVDPKLAGWLQRPPEKIPPAGEAELPTLPEELWVMAANAGADVLPQPAPTSAGVSTRIERGCQQIRERMSSDQPHSECRVGDGARALRHGLALPDGVGEPAVPPDAARQAVLPGDDVIT